MIRVGVFGATGYTGYELIKLLIDHPRVRIVFATSQRSAGQTLGDLYPCWHDVPLIAPEQAMAYVQGGGQVGVPDEDVQIGVPNSLGADVVFLCLPHGESMPVVQRVRAAGVRAIDLSADFRLWDAAAYRQWYGQEHVAPELLPQAVYGLPEVYRHQIAAADLVANPGCYPTSVLLALWPLARGGYLGDPRIIVDTKSGVSGAGRKLSLTTHFVEVNENFRPYQIGHVHRHVGEMEQALRAWANVGVRLTFAPHLLPVDRGILSTIYVTLKEGWSVERLVDLYEQTYVDEPFVRVLPGGRLASLAHVVRTNHCALSFAEAGEGDFIIVSAIDNLLKGASGQAVQNMNLMFGLDETTGL
jgi:N-acetyl-gamma-glutamyl-phosphate reductase